MSLSSSLLVFSWDFLLYSSSLATFSSNWVVLPRPLVIGVVVTQPGLGVVPGDVPKWLPLLRPVRPRPPERVQGCHVSFHLCQSVIAAVTSKNLMNSANAEPISLFLRLRQIYLEQVLLAPDFSIFVIGSNSDRKCRRFNWASNENFPA